MAPLAPSRRQDMAKVSIRALVAGTIACFMTACIAGEMCDLHELTVANGGKCVTHRGFLPGELP